MPYKDPEKQKEYMRKYRTPYMRKYYQNKNAEHDKLTERFEKTMAEFKETTKKTTEYEIKDRKEVNKLKFDTEIALSIFHKAHSIACDRSLSDSEARERIINFSWTGPYPSYFLDILNKLNKTKTEMENKKK